MKEAALRLGLRVAHRLSEVDDVDVERGIVVAFGAIIPAALLERVPMLNVHFSLLPRWRGAAPVQRAILAGDEETGVSIISLEPTLDTGPIHAERRVTVGEKTAPELTTELAHVGASLLREVLSTPTLLEHPHAQVGEVTYAEKITKEMLHLTPTLRAIEVLRTVRLGGAYLFAGGKRVVILSARESTEPVPEGIITLRGGHVVAGAHHGSWVLETVRPEGSNSMTATAWWRGVHASEHDLQWK